MTFHNPRHFATRYFSQPDISQPDSSQPDISQPRLFATRYFLQPIIFIYFPLKHLSFKGFLPGVSRFLLGSTGLQGNLPGITEKFFESADSPRSDLEALGENYWRVKRSNWKSLLDHVILLGFFDPRKKSLKKVFSGFFTTQT